MYHCCKETVELLDTSRNRAATFRIPESTREDFPDRSEQRGGLSCQLEVLAALEVPQLAERMCQLPAVEQSTKLPMQLEIDLSSDTGEELHLEGLYERKITSAIISTQFVRETRLDALSKISKSHIALEF